LKGKGGEEEDEDGERSGEGCMMSEKLYAFVYYFILKYPIIIINLKVRG